VTDLPALDEYEVRVYDSKRGRRLVVAVPARAAETVELGAKQRTGLLRGLDRNGQDWAIDAHGRLHNG